MATNKISTEKKYLGTRKISPMQIFNLTPASEEIAVVMKVTRTETNGSVLDILAQEKKDSPWREDDLGKAYLSKEANGTKLKDPVATLRKVNELLGRS